MRRRRRTSRFCCDVERAISDELEAVRFYGRLARIAPTGGARQEIRCIQRDELRHSTMFRDLQARFCCSTP